jgi:dTDP-4-amino-4,6-dideoxygalactose transaminase
VIDEEFLPFALPDIGEQEIDAVIDTLRNGWLTTGPRTVAFEREFASALGGGVHAVAVNSATAGLHLALEALGIGPGDEVLVPTWTFTATAEVVRYVGAEPVLVDVEPDTLNIDLAAAKACISDRARAVIPVHFAGVPVPRAQLEDFAAAHGLRVIEDAAHAFPAMSSGAPVGTGASEAVVFSFYATKTMTTGEGGMLVTADDKLAARARTMRLHGISKDVFNRYRGGATSSWHYDVVAPGFKYNLTDIAAALGQVQLRRSEQMRDRRASIAMRYQAAFADLPVQLPVGVSAADIPSWHLYVLRLAADAPLTRGAFIDEMARLGVACSVHFIPLHRQPYWRQRYGLTDEQFPIATAEFGRVVSLPIFSAMTDRQVQRVISAVRALLA